jgi:phytoene synthase
MRFEADRAEQYFQKAAAVLPAEDRKAMVSAEIMASIYHALLRKMERDRFQVFERDYRLHKLSKIGHAIRQLLRLF